jgi:hypothetical protein
MLKQLQFSTAPKLLLVANKETHTCATPHKEGMDMHFLARDLAEIKYTAF